MFDFLGFAEGHSIISTIAACAIIALGWYVYRDLQRWYRSDEAKRRDITLLLTICNTLQQRVEELDSKVDAWLESCGDRCDVEHCPGLAALREDYKAAKASTDAQLADIKSLMVSVSNENKNVLVELLSFIRSIWRPNGQPGKSNRGD